MPLVIVCVLTRLEKNTGTVFYTFIEKPILLLMEQYNNVYEEDRFPVYRVIVNQESEE